MIVAIFFPVFSLLYKQKWDTLGYTHAFFILPVSIGLVYWKREELARIFANTRKRFGLANLGIFVSPILKNSFLS